MVARAKKKWCCRHQGKLIILGSDYEPSLLAFHRLKSSTLPPPLPSSSTTCAEILDQYMLRHTWITEALRSGLSVAVVAELAGHSAETALKVYGHLDQHSTELKAAAERAAKRKA